MHRRFLSTLKTKVSTLPNGIRVASHETNSHFVSAGVFVNAGSRNETSDTYGCCHLLDRTTFKSTRDYSSEELVKQMELLGGQFQSEPHREMMSYQASVFSHDLPKLMEILAQIVRYPLFLPHEFEDVKESTGFELKELEWDMEKKLPEKLHAVAYRNGDNTQGAPDVNTLGRSQKILPSLLEDVTVHKVRQFRDTWFTPDRIVVVGVGMAHEELVDLANKHFGDMEPASPSILKAQEMSMQKIKYTGGIQVVDTTNLPKSPNPDDMVLTHVQVAFEALSSTDPDIYSLATLASLLGGGGSFSAGGPGKGMYTRLYTNVLNRNGWIENCNVINHSYSDSGLFGISTAVLSDPGTHHHILSVICDQLVTMTQHCTQTELERAKNMLKSNLLMSLESQLVELEDIGRQILLYGQRLDINEMCKRIDMVTTADVIRVARRVILGEPIPSPYQFNDGITKPWTPNGPTNPTVYVEGPLSGPRDSLWKIDQTLAKWGLMAPPPKTRRGFFSRL
ncbi:Mitochondrial-processing peptidase subunit alpha [Boothiomyces macroporosus]|uniref:Mitochondrial-processing peptidase subunit alpha n=1 Tax=Boothiomyces macroporosus TaxID=261099 RepID=A0AAD5Y5A6_9FUNG|nr:Mitochondrial-processing peptidase subunit alpha [Boothiomyces macroporosus]